MSPLALAKWLSRSSRSLWPFSFPAFSISAKYSSASKAMGSSSTTALHYKRSHFATQLPADYLYTASHAWIAAQGPGLWRVGLTKFATRMLGEMVDHGFEVEENTLLRPGQIVGW